MKTRTPILAIVAAASTGTAALGQNVTVQIIPQGNTALDMSPDGRWIVGDIDQDGNGFPDGQYLYDCQTGVQTILPANGISALAVSDDGTVVLGSMADPNDDVEIAAIWTQASGWRGIGWLPNAANCPSRSNGYDLSADGSVAVGLSWDGCSGRGFRWTEATGMVELEPMANGGNRASVISADGAVIGGFAQGNFNRTPVIWDGATTAGELLDPSADAIGEVHGMSDDGTILLGNYNGDAYLYTEAGGLKILGAGSTIPSWTGIAMDIADTGLIVGFDVLATGRRGWIKPASSPDLIPMLDYVEGHGGMVPAGIDFDVITRVSADGRTIIGHDFFQAAFKITIDYCPADITGPGDGPDGNVDALDFLLLIAQWATPCAGTCEADITGPTPLVPDGNVDALDFLLLIGQWGSPGACVD